MGNGIRRTDIPENTCEFVLEGEVYVNDGCNCSSGFEPPAPPEVGTDPQSPIFVPCVPIDDGGDTQAKAE